jgi:hypothetical protein
MELGRFPVRFFGGPHGGRTATTALLYNVMTFYDGYDLHVHIYTKLDELEYGYSQANSWKFEKTNDGRDRFLQLALKQPAFEIIWTDTKLLD